MFWTVALNGGPRTVNHAGVSIDEKIYSFGGYCTGEDYSHQRNIDVHVLNSRNNRWSKIEIDQEFPDVPFQRYGHTVVALDSKVYLWGGRSDQFSCDKLYVFDTETLRWSSPAVKGTVPEARDGHSACIINRCMYIFAGYLEYTLAYTQEVVVLDIDKLQWTHLYNIQGKPPSYRDFHTAISYEGKMFLWGGREAPRGVYASEQNEEYGSEVFVLDTNARRWQIIECFGDIPIGRRSHSAVMYKDKMYVFGGYNSKQFEHYNDFHQFDPRTSTWCKLEPLGDGPSCRRRHVCCIVGSKFYMFGGTSPRPGYSSIEDATSDPFDEKGLIDHDDLHILDMEPTLKTLSLVQVIKLKIDPPWLPMELKFAIKSMTLPNSVSRPINNTG